MYVVEHSPQKLHLRAFPWPVFLGLATLTMTFLGAFIYALSTGDILSAFIMFSLCVVLWILKPEEWVDLVNLTFNQADNTITITRRTLLKTDARMFDLHNLIEANVWDSIDAKAMLRHAVSYGKPVPSLVLILSSEDPPEIYKVPGARGSESGIIGIANTINAWLSIDVDSNQRQA